MSGFTRYILRQSFGPLMMFTFILTIIVWLTQSLQMLDLVINRNQSAGTFFLMTLYVLPSLLTVIIPFSLFCAALFALHRLSTDSEIVVMWSTGVSPWGLATPMLILGAGAALVSLLLNLYVMPAGYRAMKDKVYEIRADIASSMIRDGQFTNPISGLTVYNRKTSENGELHDLLIHDNRNRAQPSTYMAQLGKFVKTPDGPRLVMQDGNIQQITKSGDLSVLYFQQYTLDLTQFAGPQQAILRELSERYLHELLMPDLSRPWDRQNTGRLKAEGHNRISAPLYNIALVLIALCAFMLAQFGRRGYGGAIAVALAIGLVLRLAGFGLQSIASQTPSLVIYQYLLPIFIIFACSYLLFDLKGFAMGVVRGLMPMRRLQPEEAG